MTHFCLLFCIVLILSLFSRKGNPYSATDDNTRLFFFVVSFVLMGSLCALKSASVGNDTVEYIRIYDLSSEFSYLMATRYEKGFLLYCYGLYKVFGSSPQTLFIASSVIIYFSFGHFIWKYSKMPWLSAILFFLLMFGDTNNILRQCLAISFLLWSLDSLFNKRYIICLIFVFLATSFHSSSYIIAFVLLFPWIKLNGKTLMLIVGLSLAFYLAFAQLLSIGFDYFTSYEVYGDSVYFEGGTRIATIAQVLFALLFSAIGYYGYKRMNNVNELNKQSTLKVFVLMELAAFALYIIALRVNIIDRFALYYFVATIVMIPNAIVNCPYSLRFIISHGIIVLLLAYECISLIIRPEWNTVFPYSFFFE